MTVTSVRPATSNTQLTVLQLRAVERLAVIMTVGSDHNLPLLEWTVARTGLGLLGKIHPRDVADPRTTHLAWSQALGLTPQRAMPGYLTATARLGGVQVTLATTLQTAPKEAS